MKFIFLSDVHYLTANPQGRRDDAEEAVSRKLVHVFKRAKEEGATILQAGDLTDVARNWGLALSFTTLLFKHSPTIYCVRGQHDAYMYNEKSKDQTLIGVLVAAGLIKLLGSEPTMFGGNTAVYGSSYGLPIPKPKEQIGRTRNILVTHRPILMSKLWTEQKGWEYAPEFLSTHDKYHAILCGDIHQQFIFQDKSGRFICNTGPLLRKEASKDMFKHKPGFFLFDSDNGQVLWEEIPHSHSSEVLNNEEIVETERRNQMLENFITAVRSVGIDASVSFNDNLVVIMNNENCSDGVRAIISEYMGKEKRK